MDVNTLKDQLQIIVDQRISVLQDDTLSVEEKKEKLSIFDRENDELNQSIDVYFRLVDFEGFTQYQALMGQKADIDYVDDRLALKADQTAVDSALVLKADQTAVDSALALKADQTAVDSALALKADQTAVDSALALKADQSAVDSALVLKADQSVVDSALALKADQSAVDHLSLYSVGRVCILYGPHSFNSVYKNNWHGVYNMSPLFYEVIGSGDAYTAIRLKKDGKYRFWFGQRNNTADNDWGGFSGDVSGIRFNDNSVAAMRDFAIAVMIGNFSAGDEISAGWHESGSGDYSDSAHDGYFYVELLGE